MAENVPGGVKPPEEAKDTPQEDTRTPLEKKRDGAIKALNAYFGSYFNAVALSLKKNLSPTLETPFGEKIVRRYESKTRSYLGQINPGMKMVSGGGAETTIAPTVAMITFEEIDVTV